MKKLFTINIVLLVTLFIAINKNTRDISAGHWQDISPAAFKNYSKVRDIKVTKNGVLIGLGEDNIGDSDLWLLSEKKATQLGGDSLGNGWSNNNKVNLILTTGNTVYAGLGEVSGELWKLDNNNWTSILNGKEANQTKYHYIYSGTVINNTPCFGAQGWAGSSRDTLNGPDIFCLKNNLIKVSTDHLFDKEHYRNIYDMTVFKDGLIIGLGNMYRNGNPALILEHKNGTTKIIGGNGSSNSWTNDKFYLPLSMTTHKNKLFVSFLRDEKLTPNDFLWSYDGKKWSSYNFEDTTFTKPETNLHLNLKQTFFESRLINKIISFKKHLILLAGGHNGGGNTVWTLNTEKNTMSLIGGYGVNYSWDPNWPKECLTKNKNSPHRECTRSTWIYTADIDDKYLYIGVARANGYEAKVYRYKVCPC